MYLSKEHTSSNIAWHRPQSDTARVEDELIEKSTRGLESTTDPVEKLRLMCLSRGTSGILALGRVFRRMDDNGKKLLNKDEFIDGLLESGLDVDRETGEALFEKFDIDNSGAVSVDTFLREIRPPMSETRRAIVKQAFKKLDKGNHGVITVDEIKAVYAVTSHPRYMSGEETSEVVMKRFIESFDTEDIVNATVTLEEFMDYYSGLSVSIEHDSYFDLMMRQAYKL